MSLSQQAVQRAAAVAGAAVGWRQLGTQPRCQGPITRRTCSSAMAGSHRRPARRTGLKKNVRQDRSTCAVGGRVEGAKLYYSRRRRRKNR